MKNLLYKELRLATPPLTFFFLGFTVIAFLPGYPILCGAFFVCFGIFQSYQLGRENNDILYTVLLPVKKSDSVKAKYAAAVLLEMGAFFLFTVFTGIRMIFLSDAEIYQTNALMGANPVFLAFVLMIFLAFNVIFIGGFFRTAYRLGKPFVLFVLVNFTLIAAAESLHYFPGLAWTNALDFRHVGDQLLVLLAAMFLYVTATVISCKNAEKRFEKTDL